MSALGTLLLCCTGAAQATPEPDPVVGFVHQASGDWEDTVHASTLAVSSDIRQRASIVRKDAAQSSARIEIYLANGAVVKRDCATGACANPILIQMPEDNRRRDYLKLLKELFFAPADQEVPAATFVYRVTPTPAPRLMACEQPKDASQPGAPACAAPAGSSRSAAYLAPKYFLAGAMTSEGFVDIWGAERLGAPPTLIPASLGAAAGAILGTSIYRPDRPKQDVPKDDTKTPRGAAVGAAIGAVALPIGARTLDASTVQLSDAYQIAAASPTPMPVSGQAAFCRDELKRLSPCDRAPVSPGIYLGDSAQLYLFASAQERECMKDTFEASRTLNRWIEGTSDEASRERLGAIKASYFDRRARECGGFRPLSRTELTPLQPSSSTPPPP